MKSGLGDALVDRLTGVDWVCRSIADCDCDCDCEA
jgi:hypothetical protein